MGLKITDGFNPGDDEKAVEILKKFKGGPISDQLFAVIAGMMPTTGLVVVLVHNPKKDAEVVFVPRPDDDPTWPAMMNLPGKMLRNADFKRPDNTPENGPLERIEKSEIESELPGKPGFAGVSLNSDKRGSWAVLVYFIVLKDKSEYKGIGKWLKVSDIKSEKNLVQTEINHINVVLEKLK